MLRLHSHVENALIRTTYEISTHGQYLCPVTPLSPHPLTIFAFSKQIRLLESQFKKISLHHKPVVHYFYIELLNGCKYHFSHCVVLRYAYFNRQLHLSRIVCYNAEVDFNLNVLLQR